VPPTILPGLDLQTLEHHSDRLIMSFVSIVQGRTQISRLNNRDNETTNDRRSLRSTTRVHLLSDGSS